MVAGSYRLCIFSAPTCFQIGGLPCFEASARILQRSVHQLSGHGCSVSTQTLELVDRAYLIYEGRVLREGTRDFLINDPVSRELYLGDRFTM